MFCFGNYNLFQWLPMLKCKEFIIVKFKWLKSIFKFLSSNFNMLNLIYKTRIKMKSSLWSSIIFKIPRAYLWGNDFNTLYSSSKSQWTYEKLFLMMKLFGMYVYLIAQMVKAYANEPSILDCSSISHKCKPTILSMTRWKRCITTDHDNWKNNSKKVQFHKGSMAICVYDCVGIV